MIYFQFLFSIKLKPKLLLFFNSWKKVRKKLRMELVAQWSLHLLSCAELQKYFFWQSAPSLSCGRISRLNCKFDLTRDGDHQLKWILRKIRIIFLVFSLAWAHYRALYVYPSKFQQGKNCCLFLNELELVTTQKLYSECSFKVTESQMQLMILGNGAVQTKTIWNCLNLSVQGTLCLLSVK